jgi:hypothetical protein
VGQIKLMCVAKLLESRRVNPEKKRPKYQLLLRTHNKRQYRLLKTAKALIDLPIPLPLLSRAAEVMLLRALGPLDLLARNFLYGMRDRMCEMQLSRPRRLSSVRTMCHGACLLSVASSMRSRALE